MPAIPTVEELLAKRDDLLKANAELKEQAISAQRDIDHLRQTIASLRYKMFGNSTREAWHS